MLSHEQCELARIMTKDTTTDKQIQKEYNAFPVALRTEVSNRLDELAKAHDGRFDLAYPVFVQDAADTSKEYHLSPAALFCLYMNYRSQKE